MSGITCEMKCAECARAVCTGARALAEEAGVMKNPYNTATPPVVGAECVVLTEDPEVPIRIAYWSNGVWRDPHTARALVPEVIRYCLMGEAISALCGAGGEPSAELDGLANRGIITLDAAVRAKRFIAPPAGEAPHGATNGGGE